MSCEVSWEIAFPAKRGGKQGGQLSPEALEKFRKAGREGGMMGDGVGVFWRKAQT